MLLITINVVFLKNKPTPFMKSKYWLSILALVIGLPVAALADHAKKEAYAKKAEMHAPKKAEACEGDVTPKAKAKAPQMSDECEIEECSMEECFTTDCGKDGKKYGGDCEDLAECSDDYQAQVPVGPMK